jgi:hypothetical protein
MNPSKQILDRLIIHSGTGKKGHESHVGNPSFSYFNQVYDTIYGSERTAPFFKKEPLRGKDEKPSFSNKPLLVEYRIEKKMPFFLFGGDKVNWFLYNELIQYGNKSVLTLKNRWLP